MVPERVIFTVFHSKRGVAFQRRDHSVRVVFRGAGRTCLVKKKSERPPEYASGVFDFTYCRSHRMRRHFSCFWVLYLEPLVLFWVCIFSVYTLNFEQVGGACLWVCVCGSRFFIPPVTLEPCMGS